MLKHVSNDEAISYILQNWFDGDSNTDAVMEGDKETMVMKTTIEALEYTNCHRMRIIDILANLIDEINDKAYDIMPVSSDYFYQGIAEQMVLDKKKEIATELYEIADKYEKLYHDLEGE